MLFDILALISFLIVLLLLRRLVNVYPSLLACLIRGKESINLEASVKLSRDRDRITYAMIVPFCLVACRYRLYETSFLEGASENRLLAMYFLIFAGYILFRMLVMWLFRPHKMPQKVYRTAGRASYTFFVILTLLLLVMGGVMSFLKIDESTVRLAMLWVSAVIYVLFLFRKTQIFCSSCSVFTAFLYLCALEILPTGILVVSEIIF